MDKLGKPRIIVINKNVCIFNEMRVRCTELSISHEDEYSVAFVIAT